MQKGVELLTSTRENWLDSLIGSHINWHLALYHYREPPHTLLWLSKSACANVPHARSTRREVARHVVARLRGPAGHLRQSRGAGGAERGPSGRCELRRVPSPSRQASCRAGQQPGFSALLVGKRPPPMMRRYIPVFFRVICSCLVSMELIVLKVCRQ